MTNTKNTPRTKIISSILSQLGFFSKTEYRNCRVYDNKVKIYLGHNKINLITSNVLNQLVTAIPNCNCVKLKQSSGHRTYYYLDISVKTKPEHNSIFSKNKVSKIHDQFNGVKSTI